MGLQDGQDKELILGGCGSYPANPAHQCKKDFQKGDMPMKKKTRLFLFVFLFLAGCFMPLLAFAEEAVSAVSAIPAPQTGIWFLDTLIAMVPAITPAILALFGAGKVWAFLFSISKPITMFTSTQLPNPTNNPTIKILNIVLLVLNYISLNIFMDKNHDALPVTAANDAPPSAAPKAA